MTVNIRIWATSESSAALVLADLGSKFRESNYETVKYDLDRVDVEDPIDVDIVDEERAAESAEQ